MNITPEQARELLDGATPGPWGVLFNNEAIETDTSTVLYNTDGAVEWGRNIEHDVPLAAAAPDLAQTIAGMEWQWSVEKHDGHRWSRHGGWVGPESIARVRLQKVREDGETARLVRRLVGPVEVAE